MACTGQFAWHLGEEAEPRGEGAEQRGEGAGPWELGAEGQRLSPGFGHLWVVIALFNPGLSLDVRCTSGPRACLKNGVVGRRSLCDWGQESAGLLVSGESSAASSAGQKKLLLESAQKLSSLKLRTWR